MPAVQALHRQSKTTFSRLDDEIQVFAVFTCQRFVAMQTELPSKLGAINGFRGGPVSVVGGRPFSLGHA